MYHDEKIREAAERVEHHVEIEEALEGLHMECDRFEKFLEKIKGGGEAEKTNAPPHEVRGLSRVLSGCSGDIRNAVDRLQAVRNELNSILF